LLAVRCIAWLDGSWIQMTILTAKHGICDRENKCHRENVKDEDNQPIRGLLKARRNQQQHAQDGGSRDGEQPKVSDETRSEDDRDEKREPESEAFGILCSALAAPAAVNKTQHEGSDDPVGDKDDERTFPLVEALE
jgi:hypothetical protein